VAFSYLRDIALATHKTSSSSWSFAPSAALNAGELGVLVIAVDNLDATDGDFNVIQNVTDSAGNTWQKAGEFTNGQGGAGNGATIAIWYTVASATLPTTGSITITLRAALTAKAAIGRAYSIAAGSSVLVAATATRADDGVDPGLVSLSGLVSRGYLFVRGIASETSTTTALTPTSGWTAWQQAVTSGGGAATNMGARAEQLIATATSASSDPTLFAADHASLIVAFYEVTVNVVTGSGSLAGLGSLTASGTRIVTGSASCTGQGQLSAIALAFVLAASALSGLGTASASAILQIPSSASLQGVGTLQANGGLILAGQANLPGTGQISATGVLVMSAGASMSGSGQLSAQALVIRLGQASLQGTGQLVAFATCIVPTTSALSGTGTLSVTGFCTVLAESSLSGSGTASASSLVLVLGHADLLGTGSLAATGQVIAGAALVTGSAIL
jgi:hypothetical protein